MHAAVVHEWGAPLDVVKYEETAEPLVGPDTALVEVAAAGVNPVDWKILTGGMAAYVPTHLPLIPGWDMAGTVVMPGPTLPWLKPGDRVAAYAREDHIEFGTFAERKAVHERAIAKVPDNVGLDIAGALPLVGLTALQALDAVDVLDALRDQHPALARDAPAILVPGARRPHHGADPRLAPLEGQQGPDQRLAVEPVGLRPATPARRGDRGGIDDVALDALVLQRTVDPEAVKPGFLDHDDPEDASGARLRLVPELCKARQQADDVTAGNCVARHLLAAAR